MTPEKKPEIIELDRYRKAAERRAAEQAAKAKAKAKAASAPQRMLGSRKNAGWLLILVVVFTAAMFILPRFVHF
jgi:hypothetical protein